MFVWDRRQDWEMDGESISDHIMRTASTSGTLILRAGVQIGSQHTGNTNIDSLTLNTKIVHRIRKLCFWTIICLDGGYQ